MKQHK